MFYKKGKLLNTLQYHVDKNIDETLYQNKAFLASKWSLLQKNILLWSQRHTYYIVLMLSLAILITGNLFLWKDSIVAVAINYFPNWKKLIDWQGGFLAGQLTIVGVVYPLVIGLIGVLFQNKSAKKTIFPIYQKYSGFMFAGLSGLFLSIFIIMGYFFSASLDASTYVAICLTTALWLTFNILLTSWFFTATFLMLDESKRDRLIVRYTIHELCEADIRKRLMELLLQNSVHQGILINPDENIIKVSTLKFSDDKCKEIAVSSDDELYAYNVSFAIINIVILTNLYRLKLVYWFTNTFPSKWLVSKGVGWLDVKRESEAEFIVQPTWKRGKDSKLVLVKYNGFNLGWLTKKLIKLSFSTRAVEDNVDKSLTSMMLGFVGSANDALRDKNISEFKSSLDNIVKWHIEIASALGFTNDNREADNWLLLPTSNFFSRSYLNEILSEYYRISKAAVELISENIEFYHEVIYLHKRIFARREELVKQEGFSLIQGSYFTWTLLMEWRSYSSNSIDMRVANKYKDVLYHFVGSWESWLDYIEPRSKRSENVQRTLPLFLTHLEYTAHTSISALRYDNLEAAGWGVDMLNNWIKKVSSRDFWREEYTWKSELVTHTVLSENSESEPWISILQDNEFNSKAAFNIALANAAFDLRILTACYIILKPNSGNDESIVKYIDALLTGAAIHPTGAVRSGIKGVSKPSDLVGAYIRHRDYGRYGDASYGSWLSKTLDSFGRVNEKRIVSGRVYLGWGSHDPKSMNRAYVEIALSLSKSEWQLGRKWIDILFSNAFNHSERERFVSDLTDWLKVVDEIDESKLFPDNELASHKDNFKISVQKLIQQVAEYQNEVIANAEIDESILEHFGIVCSEALNEINSSPVYPINLFDHIRTSSKATEQSLRKVNIQKYLKENIALDVSVDRDGNEDGWLKEATRSDIQFNILKALLNYEVTDSSVYNAAEDNIKYLVEQAKSIENPILFIGDNDLETAVYEARYKDEIATKYGISFLDGYGNDYLCHLGEVEVYGVRFFNLDFSLLTSKVLFESIEFAKATDSQFVKVEYKSNEDDESVGTLSLNYWMDIHLQETQPCIKTELRLKEEE